MNAQEEKHLIKRIQEGDTRAFGLLVDRYQSMAFTLAFRMIGDREEAEDLVQESFIKAYQVLKDFRGDSKFSTWLYRIVYHKVLDFTKSARNKYRADLSESVQRGLTDGGTDSDERLEERSRILLTAMKKLNTEEQTLLHLFYFEELSLKEIGDVLQCTPNRVKVSLHRSRKKLEDLLQDRMQTV